MSFSHSPRIVTDGLVLCLDAANPMSYPGYGTVWTDLSGNGNNGTLTNGPTFSPGNSGSIVFDGVDDYVDIESSASYKVQFPLSISLWFKINSIPTTYYTLVETDNPTNSYHAGVNISIAPNAYVISYGNNTQNNSPGRRSYAATYNFLIDRWYSLTVVLPNDSIANSYVNSIEVDTPYVSGTGTTMEYSSSPMSIGYSNDEAPRWFLDGNVSTVQIYNRALSASEVLQNYEAVKSRFGL